VSTSPPLPEAVTHLEIARTGPPFFHGRRRERRGKDVEDVRALRKLL
jgi:hypothetical protein